MIQALYKLGLALMTKPKKYGHYFAPWSDPFPNILKSEDKHMVLFFDIKDNEPSELQTDSFRTEWIDKYLYRKPKGARGAPLVPTGFFYPETNEEKHIDGVQKLMSRLNRSIPDGESRFFSSTAAKQAALEKIEKELLAYGAKAQPRYKYLLTFKINGKWLGHYEDLRQILEDSAYSKYYEKSSADGKTCSVSYAQDQTVWGRIDTVGFTVNDISFNRGGFNGKDSYKMFPVTGEVAKLLEGARRFAAANLQASFFHLRYWSIPRLVEGSPEDLLYIVEALINEAGKNTLDGITTQFMSNGQFMASIARSRELSAAGNLFDFFFFEQNQAQFGLVLHLQDVSPTRIKQMGEIKKYLRNYYAEIATIKSKTGIYLPDVSFNLIKNYFGELKGTDWIFLPYFYRILEAVFYGQPLNQQQISAGFTKQIRQSFRQRKELGDRFRMDAKRALVTWQFFYYMGHFSPAKPTLPMHDEIGIPHELQEILDVHEHFFNGDSGKKGAFLLGWLTDSLLYSQEKYLGGNAPFEQKLNNLNMGIKELRALFPKLENKIRDYLRMKKFKGNFKESTQIKAEASRLLMLPSDASRDELSFAFTAGMSIHKDAQIQAAKKRKELEESE